MNLWYRSLALLAITFAAQGALAQGTLGELLDAGAVKLTKEELVALLIGSNASGPTLVGGSLSIDFKADGTYSGTLTTPAGKGGGSFGKWKVEDGGRYCTEGTAQSFGATATANCGYYFKRGGDYFYVAESDTIRTTRVFKREIRRQ